MIKFERKAERNIMSLNTASLADLIFTVLFFFMIVTTMKNEQSTIEYDTPKSQNIEKISNKQHILYIYIGRQKGENTFNVQFNGTFTTPQNVGQMVAKARTKMTKQDGVDTKICIKADKDTPMGIINDVKKSLQLANALGIIYSANQTNTIENKP